MKSKSHPNSGQTKETNKQAKQKSKTADSPTLVALKSELASHGQPPESVEECVAFLFSELSSADAIELLSGIINQEKQSLEFSESNSPVDEETIDSTVVVTGGGSTNDLASTQQTPPESASRHWLKGPVGLIVKALVAVVGFAAAFWTLWDPGKEMVAEYFSNPEIVLVTTDWPINENNENLESRGSAVWNWLLNRGELNNYKENDEHKGEWVYALGDNNLNLRVMKFKAKSNGMINWENIIGRISKAKSRCVILESNSTAAHRFLDEFQLVDSNIPIIFPGQTNHKLHEQIPSAKLFFLTADDRQQATTINRLLKKLSQKQDEKEVPADAQAVLKNDNRIAVVWDYKNPIHTKSVADKINFENDKSNPVVFFGFGENQMENSSVFLGVESLAVLADLSPSTIVFAGSSRQTAARFLAYIDNTWPAGKSVNVIFTESIVTNRINAAREPNASKKNEQGFLEQFDGEAIQIYGVTPFVKTKKDQHGQKYAQIIDDLSNRTDLHRDSISDMLDGYANPDGSEYCAFKANKGAWDKIPLPDLVPKDASLP